MLQHRAIPSTRPWRSVRFASQLSQSPNDGRRPSMKTTATTSGIAESARKPSAILSRLSDKTQSRIRRNPDTEQKSHNAHVEVAAAVHGTPRPRATSFISARSAQKRDHAAEKWFTDVRELDTNGVGQPHGLKSQPRKKHVVSESPKQHEMRPRTNLNALFGPSSARSATLLRLQTRRELGGDYTSYIPDGYADPRQFPITYARLVLGRNKHIPLNAQTGALDIIEEAIRGTITKQGEQALDVPLDSDLVENRAL